MRELVFFLLSFLVNVLYLNRIVFFCVLVKSISHVASLTPLVLVSSHPNFIILLFASLRNHIMSELKVLPRIFATSQVSFTMTFPVHRAPTWFFTMTLTLAFTSILTNPFVSLLFS